jgi:NTP pyrophosphatase (non-canonical NTP hydrolase)
MPKDLKDLPFNNLTPAQAERLDIVQEEAGEIVTAIAKIKRHGYESHNPFDPARETNREALMREIGDLMAAVDLVVYAGELDVLKIADYKARKATSFNHKRYTHHQ